MLNIVFGVLAVGLGLLVCVRPASTARILQRFYRSYPLVNHAGARQLKSRNAFIVVLGISFIVVGVFVIVAG